MYGEGKQLLREHIRNKRASEGLDCIPEDLFAKKPRQEMSVEEVKSVMERRKRNKEAAERSRKKKKVEFEKLQSENDQLNQDKCELVAMVQKLKTDINSIMKENEGLRTSFDQLKRWIGKRAIELGLTKYIQNQGSHTDSDDEPSLNTSVGRVTTEDKLLNSKLPATAPKTPSPPLGPCGDHYQPMPRPQLQTPWLVEPVVTEKRTLQNVMAPQPLNRTTAQLPENQPLVVAGGQQVVYLPKDAIIVVQGENQPVMAGTPDLHQVMTASSKIAVEPSQVQSLEIPRISSTMTGLQCNMINDQSSQGYAEETPGRESAVHDRTSAMDPATATAIESLLKLGYKIRMPQASPEGVQPAPANSSVHGPDSPDVITVPLNAPESVTNVTVTTTSETETTNSCATVNPLNCMVQLKLRENGYAIHALPAGSVLRAQD